MLSSVRLMSSLHAGQPCIRSKSPLVYSTVAVTGAGAGLGRALTLEFARHGFHVALLSRGVERLEDAAHEVRALGVEALPIPVDVADADAVEKAAATVERELGPVAVWINAAMA